MRGSPCEKHQPPCTSHLLHAQIPTTHTHIPQYSSPALAHTQKYNAQLRLVMSLSPLGLESSTQRHKHMHTTTFTQTHTHTHTLNAPAHMDKGPQTCIHTHAQRLSPPTSANTPVQPHMHIRIPATKQLSSHFGDFNTSG